MMFARAGTGEWARQPVLRRYLAGVRPGWPGLPPQSGEVSRNREGGLYVFVYVCLSAAVLYRPR